MKHFIIHHVALSLALGIAVLYPSGCSHDQEQPAQQGQQAQGQEQKTFDTPAQATEALVAALRKWSPDQLKQILGPAGDDVLASGDEVADHNAAERFLKAYDEKHQLVKEGDGEMTLNVGKGDWPMPIPLVQEKNGWRFDSEAGKDEIINRRIGRNELDVIEICKAIVDAQKEYAIANPNGDDVNEYAMQFLSDPGKKNGLYWPTAEGEEPSPLGPLVAEAVEAGYSPGQAGEPRPYHGYYFRMLKSQTDSAKGGAQDYVVKGWMIGGFAVVAYPADYGNSGIMTFIVNHEGVVYQKDLGDDTEKTAKAMTAFDPGAGWKEVTAGETPATKESKSQ